MPTALDAFMARFGGQPLGAYNPFGNPASQYANPYTPGPFTLPPVVPGAGGGPAGGNPPGPLAPPPPGQQAGLPANSIGGQHGGGGVGGQTSTNTGGAFGLGQTTSVDRTGGTINTAQNQEATLGNLANAALNATTVVGANPLGLANTVGGIVMDPNNPPLGGLVGGLLGGDGSGLAQERETRKAAGGLLSGAYKADAQYGPGTTGLLGGGNQGGGKKAGGGLNKAARDAHLGGAGSYSGPKGVVGGGGSKGGGGKAGGGGGKAGGGSHSSSGGSRSSGGTKGNRAK